MTKNTPRSVAVPTSYEPKPHEQKVLEAARQRWRARPPSPRLKLEQKGKTQQLAVDHPHPDIGASLLMEALGTASVDFLNPFLSQLANTVSKGQEPDADGLNFMLSVINGIGPRDEIEAMLAAQMAAVHMATMTFARRLNHVENIPQQDSAERAFTKLARTFTTQMEALKRYRTGGQQKVTVEHVTVQAGGQAIVGSVETGGGVTNKSEGQPRAKAISRSIPDASEPPLWGQDEEREPVPLARDAER
jgi:hypothetical protein